MESRLNVAGNPIYPMLVMFPLGLLVTATIFDIADLAGGPALLGTVAYWHVAAGLVGGVCAGLAGMVDLLATRYGSRARRTAVTYGLVAFGVLMLFAVVLMVRMRDPHRAAGGALLLLELLTLASGVLLARFGDRLLDRALASARRGTHRAAARRAGTDAVDSALSAAQTVVMRRPTAERA
ncbi:DUF2231 domain-containing protein [Spirilliplanes yamanashiensis]|uniref:DUF2231 domain-containing protein n=1 Tax=Spirilliplanes yamanashiensis TaxID=42233 RepID=A0A8J4DJZ7_9ACTN|nr:DUF2231 domain-containing protein [Spirilliplanes yamanashiensis]MDP9815509.1 putative membrane protein [Spirilliplanes yamanashiensis]GIJ03763.1 hypothetical protein Sya03_31150 [Spirilliplanes yamanashiensis]